MKIWFILLLGIFHFPSYAVDISKINDFWNQTLSYEADREDYWQTPQESWERKKGDCEDYAIAKYFDLLSQGIQSEQISLQWILLSAKSYPELSKNNKPISHMVLIYEDKQGQQWVLDNLTNNIVFLKERTDIITTIAKFSMNEIKYFYKTSHASDKKWQEVLRQTDSQITFISSHIHSSKIQLAQQ